MNTPASPGLIWMRELAWLLGSWAFSWALLSRLLGPAYLWRPMPDIQLHNTYFVFKPLLFTTLLFLPIATLVTGVRVLVGAFRYFGPNRVLVGLVSVWTLLGLLLVVGRLMR